MKVLNLYSGLGGNRKLWANVEVVAVEKYEKIAQSYRELFPNDKVIVGDSIEYLIKHYNEFDFIWASPPCQSHSKIRFIASKRGDYAPKLPDLNLYSMIIFLTHFHAGKWAVENVCPYYEPMIKPTIKLGRHLIWSNFPILDKNFRAPKVKHNMVTGSTERFGFDLKNNLEFKGDEKRSIIRNCVDPEIGLHVFNCACKKAVSLDSF